MKPIIVDNQYMLTKTFKRSVWQYMLVITAPGRKRQANLCEYKTS